MTVTIEVVNEAGGSSLRRRILLHSGDYPTSGKLEDAAVEFIRASCTANEKALDDHHAATSGVGAVRVLSPGLK
ncbi:hypothetical protein [Luteolibacter soli]|uniref:Uncharacterized protein n=1 Tax=Luteolibacter soli TaxID=3135280 RepID=A0ABU9AY10_9BACT